MLTLVQHDKDLTTVTPFVTRQPSDKQRGLPTADPYYYPNGTLPFIMTLFPFIMLHFSEE